MLHIEIPKGYIYANERTDEKNEVVKEDVFVDETDPNRYISIQKATYQFLLTHLRSGMFNGLMIYKKSERPMDGRALLGYRAINNGKLPTDLAYTRTRTASDITFGSYTRSSPNSLHSFSQDSSETSGKTPPKMEHIGMPWYKRTPLSPKTHENAEQDSNERRQNMRKLGDSPSSN